MALHTHPVQHAKNPFATLFFLVFLCGCSTASFIYTRADTIAAHYLENLVSLEPVQRSSLRDWLKQELQWHRSTQIEKYVAYLSKAERQLAAPAGLNAYVEMRRNAQDLAREFAGHAATQAVLQLATLRPEQVNELFENLEKNEQKRAAKTAKKSPGEQQQDREKRVVRTLVTWTGDITDAQRALVHAAIERLALADRQQQAARRQWLQALRQATVELHAGSDGHPIRSLLTDPEQSYPAEYRVREERDTQLMLQMLVSLDKSLTTQQRDRLREKIRALTAEVASLAS